MVFQIGTPRRRDSVRSYSHASRKALARRTGDGDAELQLPSEKTVSVPCGSEDADDPASSLFASAVRCTRCPTARDSRGELAAVDRFPRDSEGGCDCFGLSSVH